MFLKLPKFKISYFKMSLFEHVDKRKYKMLHAAKIKKTFLTLGYKDTFGNLFLPLHLFFPLHIIFKDFFDI